jgi:cytosine/adenosine deaminase-related metal-dependent hydrolase
MLSEFMSRLPITNGYVVSFITAGKGSDVRAVLVDGHVVYRNGQFAHLSDVAAMIAAAEKVGGAIIEQAGLSSRLAPAWRF